MTVYKNQNMMKPIYCDGCGKEIEDKTSKDECVRIVHPKYQENILCLKCYADKEIYKLAYNGKLDKWKSKEMETIEPIKITHKLPEKDEINHPSHYTQGKIETIEYIMDKLNREQFEGYVIGNVFKYCSRYKLKGGYQDLKKARWYLDKLIEMENI